MKRIERICKKANRLLVIALLFTSCNLHECSSFEKKLMDICIEKDTIYRVPLYSLTNFDWDNLYVIQGPRIDHEVDEITKIEYNKIVPDGPVLLLFINNGSVVKDRLSYCHGIDLYWRLDTCSVGYYKYSYNSIVEIETFMGEDGRLFLQVISDTICPLQETP